MNKPIRILGIAGSLRRKSYNRAALRAAQQLVPQDAVLDVFELDGIPSSAKTTSGNRRRKLWNSKSAFAKRTLFCSSRRNTTIPFPAY